MPIAITAVCEYSVGVKLMWRTWLHPAFTETNGCLVVHNCINGKYLFDILCPAPTATWTPL